MIFGLRTGIGTGIGTGTHAPLPPSLDESPTHAQPRETAMRRAAHAQTTQRGASPAADAHLGRHRASAHPHALKNVPQRVTAREVSKPLRVAVCLWRRTRVSSSLAPPFLRLPAAPGHVLAHFAQRTPRSTHALELCDKMKQPAGIQAANHLTTAGIIALTRKAPVAEPARPPQLRSQLLGRSSRAALALVPQREVPRARLRLSIGSASGPRV